MDDLAIRLASALGDRYTIERELGRGGVATVYLATDHKHGRKVAIKVLDPELAGSIGPERFLREIEIVSRLTHPNVLPLHDSGEADGLLYYVMPYVDGGSLRARLDREPQLPLDEAVGVVRRVAAALALAHSRGIVHRDIKPENILLPAGEAVVADFGIAHAVDAAGERLTSAGLAIGTPTYMSPEQASAGSRLDGRSDVYSLACVAYEMLTGEPPFSGGSAQAVIVRHAMDPVPPLRTLRPSVAPAVARVVERGLAKVPADRYPTVEAFAEALERASRNEALDAERGTRARLRRWAVPVVLVGAVAAAIGVWRVEGSGTPQIRRFAVLPFDGPTLDSSQAYLADGLHEAVISKLADDGLGVIARTSVLQYRHSAKSVRVIARELGVDALVETSLMRSQDSVTIEVRLVDGQTQQYVWSHPYAAGLAQVPSLAAEVAQGIAGAVDPHRARGARSAAATGRSVDPEAYDLYLKGQSYIHRLTRVDLETAHQYYERAIAKDSTYALAWAGLSTYWSFGRQRGYFTPQESTGPSESAAYTALALDSTLAEAHYALAGAKVWGEWDWAGGDRQFRRAIELRPDYAEARAFYAHLLCILHRPQEALDQLARARELDPFDPLLDWLDGAAFTVLGRYDDAIALYREALRRSPDNPAALWLLWVTLHDAGRQEQAYPVLRRWADATHDSAMVAALDGGYRRAGIPGALRAGADLEAGRAKTSSIRAWDVAVWYAAVDDRDRTLDWLERAYREHDPAMPYLGVHPSFAFLHDDPRFRALMRRMKLPE